MVGRYVLSILQSIANVYMQAAKKAAKEGAVKSEPEHSR